MVEDEKSASSPPASPSYIKLVIVGALALFVALVGAQVTVPLINGYLADGAGAVAYDEQASEDGSAAARRKPAGPALYAALDPPFVVSFEEDGGARYVQLTLQAMARSEKTIEAVKQHSPAIRNSVLFMLSGYEIQTLSTQAGKEQLRRDLLVAANEILEKNGTEPPIEELYFTSLVIQ
jgi:flagellar FliL protein